MCLIYEKHNKNDIILRKKWSCHIYNENEATADSIPEIESAVASFSSTLIPTTDSIFDG